MCSGVVGPEFVCESKVCEVLANCVVKASDGVGAFYCIGLAVTGIRNDGVIGPP